MGIDFLDLTFRIEKLLGVTLDNDDWFESAKGRARGDMTAGELHFLVGVKLREAELPVPWSCWTRVRVAVAETAGVPIHEVKRDSWLCEDLGLT